MTHIRRHIVQMVFLLCVYSITVMAQQSDTTLTFAQKKQIKTLFFEALEAKQFGNNEKAITLFNEILQINSNEDAAMSGLANIYIANSQYTEARKLLEKATEINPKNEWYLMRLADIYDDEKVYEPLLTVLDKLISLNPQKVEFYQNKAATYLALKQLNNALQMYQTIEDNFGESDDNTLSKIKIYKEQGDTSKTLFELKAKLKKNPSLTEYTILLADMYIQNTRYEEAQEMLKNGLLHNPGNVEILLKTADVYRYTNKEDLALESIKEVFRNQELEVESKNKILLGYFSLQTDHLNAIDNILILTKIILEQHPEDGAIHSIYAGILTLKGNFDEAIIEYKKAIQLDVKTYQLWESLIRLELAQKQFQAAIIDAQESLTYYPNQIELNYLLGLSYSQNKEYQNAIDNYIISTNLPTENNKIISQIYVSLGDAYYELNNVDASFLAYQRAIEIDSKNAFALNNYAYYLSLKNKDLKKAEQMSKLSNELEPNNASFEDTYAWVLFKQKKYKGAKEWIQKALAKEKNVTQLEHYGDILYHMGDEQQAIILWQEAKTLGEGSTFLNKKINDKKYYE